MISPSKATKKLRDAIVAHRQYQRDCGGGAERLREQDDKEEAATSSTGRDASFLRRVQKYVSLGADVMHKSSPSALPLLCAVVEMEHVAALEALLATPSRIDFTVCDGSSHHALLYICLSADRERAVAMLRAVVERLHRREDDVVCWGGGGGGGCTDVSDFLAWASNKSRLSLFWPVVREEPYYAAWRQAGRRIPLAWEVRQHDWERMTDEDRACFEAPEKFR